MPVDSTPPTGGMTAEQVREFVDWLWEDMEICKQELPPENGNQIDKAHWEAALSADRDVWNKLVEMGVISKQEAET